MFYEGYHIKRGDTISGIGTAYGYKAHDWKRIWESPKDSALVAIRRMPEKIQPGDQVHIPIPWVIVSKHLTKKHDGAEMIAERNGELGKQLTWVQTVYRHNQPIGPNPNPFCVDACTPDDDLPFYWTNKEIDSDQNLRKKFKDHSARPPHRKPGHHKVASNRFAGGGNRQTRNDLELACLGLGHDASRRGDDSRLARGNSD